MNFSSSCPLNFPPSPCSPHYLLFHASFFSRFPPPPPPRSVFHLLDIYFVSPHDAMVLFHYLRDGGDNPVCSAGTGSSCQDFLDKHGERERERVRCVSVRTHLCLCLSTRCSEFLKFEINFTEKTPHTQTYVGRLVMTPSTLCPLTFGCCVNDEHLEGLLTSDLPLFTSLMGGRGLSIILR